MTRGSVREYAAALRGRYLKANRAGKKLILDEFCQTTGYHRKAAIRLLAHPSKVPQVRRGRRKTYAADVHSSPSGSDTGIMGPPRPLYLPGSGQETQ